MNPKDLSAGAWWINPYYYTVETFNRSRLNHFMCADCVAVIKATSIPPDIQNINTALKTNDEEVWDLAFKKYRYFIIVQFKKTMSGLQDA